MRFPKVIIDPNLTEFNALNNRRRVIINPTIQYPAAVLAQECFESRWKWWPWNLVWRRLFDAGRRRMEIRGHESEVQAVDILYGEDMGQWRDRKARIMKRSYDGIFDDYSVEELKREMRKYSKRQRKFVLKHYEFFVEWETVFFDFQK